MNQREKLIAIVCGIAIALGVFFQFLYDPLTAAVSGEGQEGSLATVRQEFAQYKDVVESAARIRGEYESVTFNVPEGSGGKRPGNVFMDELYKLLTIEFQQEAPRIEPYKMSPISKVEDYYFVDVQVHITGTVETLVRLLAQMEARGLLIRDFKLSKQGTGRNAAERDAVLDVTVSQLVQHDRESRRILSRRRGG